MEGVCAFERLYALGLDVTGVCVGVWLKGMYLCVPSMLPGLLREWLCSVLVRDGGCACAFAYCEAFDCNGGCCMAGNVVGAVYDVAGLEAPPAGCREPGRVLFNADPALEGRILEECEWEPSGVACCTLKDGAALPEYAKSWKDCVCCCWGVLYPCSGGALEGMRKSADARCVCVLRGVLILNCWDSLGSVDPDADNGADDVSFPPLPLFRCWAISS